MTMSGIDAFGTQMLRGNGAGPEVFTAIAGVADISLPEVARETYDGTAHDSPGGYREFVGGLKDGGEVTITLRFDPAVHITLREDLDDAAPRTWRIAWPPQAGGDGDEFKAWMTGWSGSAPHDGLLSADVTFKITGPVTPVVLP